MFKICKKDFKWLLFRLFVISRVNSCVILWTWNLKYEMILIKKLNGVIKVMKAFCNYLNLLIEF